MPGEDPAPRPDHRVEQLCAEGDGRGGRRAWCALLPIARDTEAALATVLGLADGADLVVTIGGASVGDHDLVARVAERLGMERAFYKIAMRPGKPLMAGRLGGVPMLGLPGNPGIGHRLRASVPAAACCARCWACRPPPRAAAAVLAVRPAGQRPARALHAGAPDRGDRACPMIAPFDRQDSALLSVLAEADALLIRPIGDGAAWRGRDGGLPAALTRNGLTQTGNTGRTWREPLCPRDRRPCRC